MKALIFVSIAIAAATACAGSAEVSGDRRVVGGVTMTFTVKPARSDVGRAVRLAMRLTNNTGRAEKLTFTSGQQYDFWITEDGKEIWRWSDDRSFTQAIEERMLAPQDSLTLAESWTPERPGRYVAHGRTTADKYGRALTGELTVGEE